MAAVTRFALGCAGTGILSYQAGAMNAENAALGAVTSAEVATYTAVRHATAATRLPWWSLGIVGLGFLYLAVLENLPEIGIVKRGL